MSFDTGTEVFTISPKSPYTEYTYFYRGIEKTVSADVSASCPFATSRQWWLYYSDENATLTTVSSLTNGIFEILRDNVFVAELIWNKAGTELIKGSFEGHGLMAWYDHWNDHATIRTKYESGLSVVPINNSTDVTIAGGTIWDEDIPWDTSAIGVGENILTMWREGTGSGVATWDGAYYYAGVKTNAPAPNVVSALGKPKYNLDTGGTWSPALASGTGVFNPLVDLLTGTITYTYTLTNACGSSSSDVVVTVTLAPDAGTDNTIIACVIDGTVDLFTQLGGTPQTGGTWSPSLTSGTGVFDPLVDTDGVYIYTVTATAPCTIDATAQITVTTSDIVAPGIVDANPTFCLAENPTVSDLDASISATGTITQFTFIT